MNYSRHERTRRIVREKESDRIWQRLGQLNQANKLTFEIVFQAGLYAIFNPVSAIKATRPLHRMEAIAKWLWRTSGWKMLGTCLLWMFLVLFVAALLPTSAVALDALLQAFTAKCWQLTFFFVIARKFIKLFI